METHKKSILSPPVQEQASHEGPSNDRAQAPLGVVEIKMPKGLVTIRTPVVPVLKGVHDFVGIAERSSWGIISTPLNLTFVVDIGTRLHDRMYVLGAGHRNRKEDVEGVRRKRKIIGVRESLTQNDYIVKMN